MIPINSYLVVGAKPWSRRIFNEYRCQFPGNWSFIGEKKDLNFENIQALSPRYIFFLHWSWKVPEEITENYECVCFHMTDVPYGRGGSPLQNLIVRGHHSTKLTALRMVGDFDAGPVYLKKELCLGGSAEEIYIRATYLSFDMIRDIIETNPEPVMQNGNPTLFTRRQPSESTIPKLANLSSLHDFIRMLDAQGYPEAFLKYKGFKFEFTRSALLDNRIKADVTITRIKEEKS